MILVDIQMYLFLYFILKYYHVLSYGFSPSFSGAFFINQLTGLVFVPITFSQPYCHYLSVQALPLLFLIFGMDFFSFMLQLLSGMAFP